MRKQNESTRTLYLEFHRILDNKIRMITKKVVRQCNFFFVNLINCLNSFSILNTINAKVKLITELKKEEKERKKLKL